MNYRHFHINDYDNALQLWLSCVGIQLRDADSRHNTERYLTRNPSLSFVAEDNGVLVGTILAGHDGRRGYVQHLAVAESHRKQGIATQLVELCLAALHKEGIEKSHLFVLHGNSVAEHFWQQKGWKKREEFNVYSYQFDPEKNA